MTNPYVAIVDYGLGNLFSVQQAVKKNRLKTVITSSKDEILNASAVILTGVGAFGVAMESLRKLKLVDVLKEFVNTGKPFFGICLGMQILMTESYEFGKHEGLNIIEGKVLSLKSELIENKRLKVPNIGWKGINYTKTSNNNVTDSLLADINDGAEMYFVHSFYVEPKDPSVILATTKFGHQTFCSVLHRENIFACQFHPENSGSDGLKIYMNFTRTVKRTQKRSN